LASPSVALTVALMEMKMVVVLESVKVDLRAVSLGSEMVA
jgi:hypothetical protein